VETRELVKAERTRSWTAGPIAPVQAPDAISLGKGLRSWSELRVGQMVEGVVTSVTPFGAFVQIGLEAEAMIHVSEIADRFVKDPAEVVRPGQRVLAKVLALEPARQRISLSLRREEKPRPRSDGNAARANAISALDKLFKK
jgi:uncharacterized protein